MRDSLPALTNSGSFHRIEPAMKVVDTGRDNDADNDSRIASRVTWVRS
jgi:hypothetical protein